MVCRISPHIGPWNQDVRSVCLCGLPNKSYTQAPSKGKIDPNRLEWAPIVVIGPYWGAYPLWGVGLRGLRKPLVPFKGVL